jgi:hypothetical protein
MDCRADFGAVEREEEKERERERGREREGEKEREREREREDPIKITAICCNSSSSRLNTPSAPLSIRPFTPLLTA